MFMVVTESLQVRSSVLAHAETTKSETGPCVMLAGADLRNIRVQQPTPATATRTVCLEYNLAILFVLVHGLRAIHVFVTIRTDEVGEYGILR